MFKDNDNEQVKYFFGKKKRNNRQICIFSCEKKQKLMNDNTCLCVSSLPCSDSVRLSCYSWGQSPYLCHSHMVHKSETPTNPWDTGGQFYQDNSPVSVCDQTNGTPRRRMVTDIDVLIWRCVSASVGVCTCVGSTGRSGCLRSHRRIHGRSWASGDTEPHFHTDSNGKHLCSFSHSNLEMREEDKRMSSYAQKHPIIH